jgi:hypothetical protein
MILVRDFVRVFNHPHCVKSHRATFANSRINTPSECHDLPAVSTSKSDRR